MLLELLLKNLKIFLVLFAAIEGNINNEYSDKNVDILLNMECKKSNIVYLCYIKEDYFVIEKFKLTKIYVQANIENVISHFDNTLCISRSPLKDIKALANLIPMFRNIAKYKETVISAKIKRYDKELNMKLSYSQNIDLIYNIIKTEVCISRNYTLGLDKIVSIFEKMFQKQKAAEKLYYNFINIDPHIRKNMILLKDLRFQHFMILIAKIFVRVSNSHTSKISEHISCIQQFICSIERFEYVFDFQENSIIMNFYFYNGDLFTIRRYKYDFSRLVLDNETSNYKKKVSNNITDLIKYILNNESTFLKMLKAYSTENRKGFHLGIFDNIKVFNIRKQEVEYIMKKFKSTEPSSLENKIAMYQPLLHKNFETIFEFAMYLHYLLIDHNFYHKFIKKLINENSNFCILLISIIKKKSSKKILEDTSESIESITSEVKQNSSNEEYMRIILDSISSSYLKYLSDKSHNNEFKILTLYFISDNNFKNEFGSDLIHFIYILRKILGKDNINMFFDYNRIVSLLRAYFDIRKIISTLIK